MFEERTHIFKCYMLLCFWLVSGFPPIYDLACSHIRCGHMSRARGHVILSCCYFCCCCLCFTYLLIMCPMFQPCRSAHCCLDCGGRAEDGGKNPTSIVRWPTAGSQTAWWNQLPFTDVSKPSFSLFISFFCRENLLKAWTNVGYAGLWWCCESCTWILLFWVKSVT